MASAMPNINNINMKLNSSNKFINMPAGYQILYQHPQQQIMLQNLNMGIPNTIINVQKKGSSNEEVI